MLDLTTGPGIMRRPAAAVWPEPDGMWQATARDVASARRAATSAHSVSANGQRVRKRQPDGGLIGLGGSPLSGARGAAARVHRRHRRQQRLRIGMLRLAVDPIDRPDLDDLAEVHDHHAIADVADDVEVMGDEDVGQVKARLQVASRFSTCAWTDLSSAETASSRITRRGSSASARAMLMRCRWPPESSCG